MSGEETEGQWRQLLHALGVSGWAVEQIITRLFPARPADEHSPMYVISVAAELAGMHPQTLRQYDRLGLVTPLRTKGRGRRYSTRDIDRLREIQKLSQDEGVNLAGIDKIMALQRRVDELEREVSGLRLALGHVARQRTRVFAADSSGGVTQYERGQRPQRSTDKRALVHYGITSTSLVVWDN